MRNISKCCVFKWRDSYINALPVPTSTSEKGAFTVDFLQLNNLMQHKHLPGDVKPDYVLLWRHQAIAIRDFCLTEMFGMQGSACKMEK